MEWVDLALLLGAAVLFIGLLFGTLSVRVGIPSLLIFLVVGMLVGKGGPGGVEFDNLQLGYLVSNLAIAIILLEGGLRTRLSTFRVGFRPALSLATVGVFITSALVGGFATWLLGLDWKIGLLLGAIVGSTDAAAVFNVLRGAGIHLNERVSSTLEIESGLNDPMAIFLTLTLIEILTLPSMHFGFSTLLVLIKDFGIGLVVGLALGVVLSILLARMRSNEGLHALLLCAGGTMVFAAANLLGGSGFLAVYIAGLVAGNRHDGISDNVLRNMDAFGWLAQSCLFLLLGLLVTPAKLLAIAPFAILIALFLIFVARPVAGAISLFPLRFTWPERFFISWTGLRGAVPIVLAMFPLLANIEHAELLFNITFVVVLTSLLVQGSFMGRVANWLKVTLPSPAEPLQVTAFAGKGSLYMMQFYVEKGANARNRLLKDLTSDRTTPLLLSRFDENLPVTDDLQVQEGDKITWLGPIAAKPVLADLCQTITPSIKRFYGDFTLHGDVVVSDLASAYGIDDLTAEEKTLTLDGLFRQRIGKHPVVSDFIYLGNIRLRIRSLDEGRVQQVGIRLPKPDTP